MLQNWKYEVVPFSFPDVLIKGLSRLGAKKPPGDDSAMAVVDRLESTRVHLAACFASVHQDFNDRSWAPLELWWDREFPHLGHVNKRV